MSNSPMMHNPTTPLTLHNKPSAKNIIILLTIALLVRLFIFYFYVQHEERYCQADSMDYHIAALGIASGNGMYRPDTKQPIFWRTPGYPVYLSLFYHLYGLKSFSFTDNKQAQKMALLLQIMLCSFVPLLLFFLAYILTASYPIAWITAWISVFHVGFVLSSTYLLTDGLALLLFLGFLLYLYKSLATQENYTFLYYSMSAALLLSGYTWMRPMGQVIALITLFLLGFMKTSIKKKLLSLMLFSVVFFGSLAPWYMRNYELTGNLFFCPLLGPYLTLFSAPKIKARVERISLEKSHQLLSYQGGKEAQQAIMQARLSGSPKIVCTELACLKAAMPWVINYPLYFIKDWVQEVIKTTFDLYSSQLVSLAANTYKWDPLIEYLDEKVAACLYKQPMPLFMRAICWLEFIFALVLWAGILGGLWQYIIKSLNNVSGLSNYKKNMVFIWLTAGLIIAATLGITGGFGYARLRLPVESLMIILALTFWQSVARRYAQGAFAKLGYKQVSSL